MKKCILVNFLFVFVLSHVLQADPRSSIEHEVHKHGAWVETFFEETPHPIYARVRVNILSPKQISRLASMGMAGFHGLYQMKHDELTLLADPAHPSELTTKTVEAIDHELWHLAFDNLDKIGPIGSSEYVGPSREEIEAYAKAKAGSPAFAALREKLDHGRKLLRSLMEHRRDKVAIESALTKSLESLERVLAGATASGEGTIARECGKRTADGLFQDAKREGVLLKDLYREWKACSKETTPILSMPATASFEDTAQMAARMKELRKRVETSGQIIAALKTKMLEAQERARKAKLDRDIAAFDREIAQASGEERTSLERARDAMKKHDEDMRSFHAGLDTFGDKSRSFAALFDDSVGSLAAQQGSEDIAAMIGDTNEIMARIHDSLYKLHYGAVEENRYPLDEDDLQFLSRFSFRGKPMFAKGIEKYRLGRELLTDGVSPDEVVRRLQYATAYSYRGKVYSWPENNAAVVFSH